MSPALTLIDGEDLHARAVAALEQLERRGALRARLALYRAISWSLSFTTIDMATKVNTHAALGLATELAYILEGGLADDGEFFEAHGLLVHLDGLGVPLVSELARLHHMRPTVEPVREALNEHAFAQVVYELESTLEGGAS